jgi:hypothetical protein
MWWESRSEDLNVKWCPWAKGGSYSRFFYDIDTVIAWTKERQSYTGFLGTENRPLERPASLQHFFRPGLTWPRRTNGLSFRVMPVGCIFGDKGPATFVEDDDTGSLLALCGIVNSQLFAYLVSIQLARTELAQSFEVGLIQQTPVPHFTVSNRGAIARLVHRAWSLKRTFDTVNEISHTFILPAPLLRRIAGFDRGALDAELACIQAEIDSISFRLYGLQGEDRSIIEAWNRGTVRPDAENLANGADTPEKEEDDGEAILDDTKALLSWSVGAAFGRFDIRLATGERAIPPEPEPFDPLPAKNPGMVPNGEPVFAPCGAILVDDPGHRDDLTSRVRSVYERVGEPVPDDLGPSLTRSFFPAHIKAYSKSRRKAPIYWQLATPSASYSVWLYIQAFTRDTLYQVQNDYVAPKLQYEAERLERMRSEAGPSPGPKARRELAAQEGFVDELRAFLDEVKRVAPLWTPDIDDGVVINFAPLWRLVPQHKAWQRELKDTWDALSAGDHDWVHLAMHLWPERVVRKCATDRSLAIAHDLEEMFWEEDEDGKWQPRLFPLQPIEELVRERSSPAVKSALRSLLEAPVVGLGNGRGRARAGQGNRR